MSKVDRGPNYKSSNWKCSRPGCDGNMSVKDSRPTHLRDMQAIRRRRACTRCGYRYTTFECLVNEKTDMFQELIKIKSELSNIAHQILDLTSVIDEKK